MESNDDTYESEKEYEKNMYASGNAEDYMNEVEDEEEWNMCQEVLGAFLEEDE